LWLQESKVTMKSRQAGTVLFFLFLAAAWLWAQPVWEEKPYTAWTLEETQQILRDSPWTLRVGGEPASDAGTGSDNKGAEEKKEDLLLDVPDFASGDKRQRGDMTAVVQWVSAFTMRQAMARQGQLQGTMRTDNALRLIMMNPEQYVIAVRGQAVSLLLAGMPDKTQEALQAAAYLRPQGGEPIHPLGIEVNLQGEPAAFFYFPRGEVTAPLLTPEQGQVDFHWSSKVDELSVTFDLSKMTRGGKPDL
jgi:hypothetical protein